MLACGNFTFETNPTIKFKASNIYIHEAKIVLSEPDSSFQHSLEYGPDEPEHKSMNVTGQNKCNSQMRINNDLITNKKCSGRPPKRYNIPFQCDICCFVTAYAKYFRTHMSEAHQEEQARIFKCPHPHCTEAYVEERFLRDHIRHIHDCIARRPKLLCAECGKGFPKQSHLRRHSYVHYPDEKPFLCEYCPMRFASQSSLTRHIDGAHNEHKPHKCETCGKAFGHIYGLKAHKMRIHLT